MRRGRVEREMDDELRFHVLMRTRENVDAGMAPDDALRSARRAFGNVDVIKESCRDVRGGGMVETFIKDVRFAVRRMAKSPVFTTIAVLSLALGIGANTAIFGLVNAVLLRPLPVEHPEQLVSVYPVGRDDSIQTFSYPNYVDFRDRNDVLSGFYVTRFAPVSLNRNGGSERVWGFEVSANYFDVIGVKAALGRTLVPDDDRAMLASPVVVLSHGCWKRRFGGDPGVVGSTVDLNGHGFTVVGVTPEAFTGTEIAYSPELYVPMTMAPWVEPGSKWIEQRDSQNIFATGRLKPGVTETQAVASLNVLAAQLGKEFPDSNEGQTIEITPPGLIHPMLRGPVVGFAGILMGTVGLVLVIACTNLANLLLGRATERRREIAVRLALGASRGRLVRQLLTESVMLSLIGGAAGLALAAVIVRVVSALRPPIDFPLWIDMPIDVRVFGFSLLVSVATGVAFGLVPALQATKPQLVPALKEATSQAGAGRSLMRRGLVVAQVALSLVMLIAAGLVIRTLQHLQTMSPGFDPRDALMLSVDPGLQGYDRPRTDQFARQLAERVRALPGVKSAALTDFVPLSLNYNGTGIYVEGAPPARGVEVPEAMDGSVGPGYFETMRIPVLQGRTLEERDTADSPEVAVVNETFVHKFYPGSDAAGAIGKRFSYRSAEGPWVEIVGVVGDGKYFSISEDPRPFAYFALAQGNSTTLTLLVRTSGDPESMAGPVREEVRRLDATMPVYGVKSLSRHMALSLFPARVAASLLGAFGLLALTLAAIGVYGVMAYSVAQRTREIGIRMALGARPADVLRMVVRQGLQMSAVGLVAGLVGALAVTQLMSSLLYGVTSTDVPTYVLISLLLAAVVLLASSVPALRAARVDPIRALRYE
jgi:predicted permease